MCQQRDAVFIGPLNQLDHIAHRAWKHYAVGLAAIIARVGLVGEQLDGPGDDLPGQKALE